MVKRRLSDVRADSGARIASKQLFRSSQQEDADASSARSGDTIVSSLASTATSTSTADTADSDERGRWNADRSAFSGPPSDSDTAILARQLRVNARLPRRRALVWFRRDLRLHDNLALNAALRTQQAAAAGDMAILPIYIIHRPVRKRCGAVRFQFLLESVQDLARSLSHRQARLLVLRGDAEDVLRVVLPAWGITDLFFEDFVMPYARERDARVRTMAQSFAVKVASFPGATLFDPHAIIRQNGGKVPTDFERMLELTGKLPQPGHPLPAPTRITNGARFTNAHLSLLLRDYCRFIPHVGAAMAGVDSYNGSDDSNKDNESRLFGVPTLIELGLSAPETHSFLYGGETEAMRMLDDFCADETRVGLFEKPRTSPVSVDAPSTTALSGHLALGCLSPREFFYRVMFIQLQFPLRPGPPQVTLDGQLMWREFFYCYAVGTPHFDSQEHNPLCKQVDWRLRAEGNVLGQQTQQSNAVDADERLALRQLQSWKDGRTGFPWIDAVMRQVNQEGWTHHAGRHAVACFLTRGGLYISWLRGAAYFQEKCIDLDWPINVGNWLWRWDPHGLFVRKYVPELRHIPDKFVHEPWKAPLRVQRDAGCLIGKDYPFPIVDSKMALRRCMAGMSRAYSDVETGATVTPPSTTRADGADSDGESLWSTNDMCYNYRSADTTARSRK